MTWLADLNFPPPLVAGPHWTPLQRQFAAELCQGLRAEPPAVSPKWLYDEAGSRLFDRICTLPEYYPTRTELALLQAHAPDLAERLGPQVQLVEFGAGASVKVQVLLQALQRPAAYLPVDISGDYLLQVVPGLHARWPGLAVQPVVADFTQPLALPALPPGARRAGFFPGGSIGNFTPTAARQLLRGFRQTLAGGGLLVGVDLVKDPARLHAAYNDSAGVTAAFNLNLWARANRELGADFDLDGWCHAAFYHPGLQRIEMHLVSRRAQVVHIAGQRFRFDEGQSVHTENSCKYTVPGFQALACSAGWRPSAVWTDPERLFALHWLEPAGPSDAPTPEEDTRA